MKPPVELYSIESRGPDSHGFEEITCHGHRALLVHSRLSIIDLSELAHQPMHDPASGWWISYNGEIYNYLEVRAELQRLGWDFRSSGDTEVVLKAWAQWGADAMSRFNGMFAFAAFHPGLGELWLVRDRFGVKPLTWGKLPDNGITFSSSVAGVAKQVGGEVDINYCARGVRYKVYETEDSGSPFSNVYAVPAGSWVKFKITGQGINIAEGRWYDLGAAVDARAESVMRSTDDELIEHCRELFNSAVMLRLRSDVPVAVSLSGGLDSSAVASLASKKVAELRGFTYGAPYAQRSEGPVVRGFSEASGVQVTYVWPQFTKAALSDALEGTLAFQEAPFAGLSLIAQNEVYRAAHEANFKVLLGGQGGDEAFAGYRKFFIVAMREAAMSRNPWGMMKLMYSFALMLIHEAGQARNYLENVGRYRNRGNGQEQPQFRLLNWSPVAQNLWGARHTTLAARQIEDIRQWSLPTLLRYEDRNSMGYGVESRLPFMDYRLLELALALPTRLKISRGYGKWILRRISAGVVPDSVRLNRMKRGFDVTQEWVRGGVGESLRRMIFDHRSSLTSHLQPNANLDALLSDAALAGNSNLLNEALMLAWLTQPIRHRSRLGVDVRPS